MPARLVVSVQSSSVFSLARPPPNAPRINTRQPARLSSTRSAHVAGRGQRMVDVQRDQAVERGTTRREDERGRKTEERRQAWRIHPAHSPALYMCESAAADHGQPLPPRSTLTFRRRGIRGREEAKKRGRAEPIARAGRPVSGSMRTPASPARMTRRARVDVVRVMSHGSEGGGMVFSPPPRRRRAILRSCCSVSMQGPR